MRRNRRGGGSGLEFGGSGEDSFVAVVVTKLTGRPAVHPAADDGHHGPACPRPWTWLRPGASDRSDGASRRAAGDHHARVAPRGDRRPAVHRRPGRRPAAAGPLRWTLDGTLARRPDASIPATGVLQGTPTKGTPEPLALAVRVSDGTEIATRPARLLVYQSDAPLTTPAWWKPGIPPDPLAGLARPGRRLPGPLAGPPGRHEHAGEPGTEGRRRVARDRRVPAGVARGLPALRDLPYPHTSEHVIGDAGARRVALGRRAEPARGGPARTVPASRLRKCLETFRKDSWPPLAGKSLRWWRVPDIGREAGEAPIEAPVAIGHPYRGAPRCLASESPSSWQGWSSPSRPWPSRPMPSNTGAAGRPGAGARRARRARRPRRTGRARDVGRPRRTGRQPAHAGQQ